MEIHNVLCFILESAFDESLLISTAHAQRVLIIVELDLVIDIDELL
jgi:hypothetical protein